MWLECIILRVASARFSRSTRFCRMVAGYFRVAFPFLFGGTFIEASLNESPHPKVGKFPFLFGGTFIEALFLKIRKYRLENFPSFSEGLSLRPGISVVHHRRASRFPFLFGGTFIEAPSFLATTAFGTPFPFLFGGTFIEACIFTSLGIKSPISLPFRRDFH